MLLKSSPTPQQLYRFVLKDDFNENIGYTVVLRFAVKYEIYDMMIWALRLVLEDDVFCDSHER